MNAGTAGKVLKLTPMQCELLMVATMKELRAIRVVIDSADSVAETAIADMWREKETALVNVRTVLVLP